jgi:hypothetical protein
MEELVVRYWEPNEAALMLSLILNLELSLMLIPLNTILKMLMLHKYLKTIKTYMVSLSN